MRFAPRCGWILPDPVEQLEHDERPRPQRLLGRAEIERLLWAYPPRDAADGGHRLYTGLHISEMLRLIWDDVDFAAGVIHVRAQLSRAHRGAPPQRVAPKTPASVRDVPLVAQLARLLNAHRQGSRFTGGEDWVFATARGTPYAHRNVSRRVPRTRAQLVGLNTDGPPLRFQPAPHLRHPPDHRPRARCSPVSRILGHARITITLGTYTHLFE